MSTIARCYSSHLPYHQDCMDYRPRTNRPHILFAFIKNHGKALRRTGDISALSTREKLEVRASFEGQADDEGITGVEVNEEERFLNET